MMNPSPSRKNFLALLPLLAVFLAPVGSARGQEAPPRMDNQRLGELLEEHFADAAIEGRPGFWRIALPEEEAGPPAQPGDGAGEDGAGEAEGGQPAAPAEGPAEEGAEEGDRLPAVVIVLTDERADRMRVMTPIRPFDPGRPDDIKLALVALHANYDRALDARYAVQNGVLWSVFIHPLGSLTPADLENALVQVLTLRDNTGTTFSSSDLLFGGEEEEQEKRQPLPEEDNLA